MYVVATAGHVDHGKSTLVEALTGTDPDRWAEEKARGLTIDLGFAHTVVDGLVVSFIDVPGHERFLANMLAGVGGVAACLFVVDAADGWKPQSEEHLRILELVGVEHGVVALTKVDRVEQVPDLGPHLAGTFLADAEVVPVAAPVGLGLDELRAALARCLRRVPPVLDDDRPRLWVDRSFSARGAGTIVTGTLLGGSVAVADRLVISPGGPPVRVRGIQAHHELVEQLAPGSRCALNLAGIDHAAVGRGQAVVRPGQWRETDVLDATLSVLPGLRHRVSRKGAYALHTGSAEAAVRLRLTDADSLGPGESGPVRAWLAGALPLAPGDRFVLRESGRQEIVGGGRVLDVDPLRPAPPAEVTAEAAPPDSGYLARLQAAPFSPPAPDGVAPKELRQLALTAQAVQQDGVWFAESAVVAAGKVASALLADGPFTVAQLRDALHTNRRHALALAAILDDRAITLRRGDLRHRGPRTNRG